MPKTELRFDGKLFSLHTRHFTNSNANDEAESMRRKGFNVRMIKSGGFYCLYARKKRRKKK